MNRCLLLYFYTGLALYAQLVFAASKDCQCLCHALSWLYAMAPMLQALWYDLASENQGWWAGVILKICGKSTAACSSIFRLAEVFASVKPQGHGVAH